MNRIVSNIFIFYLFVLCVSIAMTVLNACDRGTDADASVVLTSSSKAKSSSSKKAYPDSFKPNDKKYPYANIPRIVIETEKRTEIKDRETEIPAKLQIWGEKEAESEIMDLTIRGRGNTSWKHMPKKSYKIEFDKKQSLLGMPKDKDWALISNYADKSLMRNYIAYKLSTSLNPYYSPRCEFAELYLNGEYLGVYLLTETIKIGKNRIDIPKNNNSFIVEVDGKYRKNEQVVFSKVIKEDGDGKPFRIHDPKEADDSTLKRIEHKIQEFEYFLKDIKNAEENEISEWIDIDESIKHYWVQEFSKNPDAEFCTSVFFSWVENGQIKMGPVWDFDLAFGNHSNEKINFSDNWHIRKYWYSYLFKDNQYEKKVTYFWNQNRNLFLDVLDSIDSCKKNIEKSAKNNFKRWIILKDHSTEWWKNKSFDSYDAAVDDLKNWVSNRIQWIDSQVE